MNFRNLEEGYLQTIPAKYQYNLASGFREEDFLSFLHRYIRELAPPPGGHVFFRYIIILEINKRVTYRLFLPNINIIWPVVSEKKIVVIVET